MRSRDCHDDDATLECRRHAVLDLVHRDELIIVDS